MLKSKIICILLAIILIFSTSMVFSAENTSDDIKTKSNVLEDSQRNTQENVKTNNIASNTKEINELNQQRNELDDKLEEANSKLEYVQGEMSEYLLEIQKLSDKIAKYETENKELAEQLSTLEKSITETTQLLETVTAEYTEKDNLLRERLVVFYKEGELSFLDLLLSSTSLSEFLSRYYAMKKMTEYDNQLIDKVAEQKELIETSKKKLENETAEVKILKAKAEQNEIIMKNTKILYEGYVEQLSDEEKKLNDEINEYKLEYARIETSLQQISTDINDFQIQYTGGKMIWPVAISGTAITSYYGTRVYPLANSTAVTDFHLGIDISAKSGSPAVAALDGVVTYAGWLGSYGNCIMLYHGDGITTVYGHGQKVLTKRGEEVKQGDIIMEVGSTGNSTGPHLHFEVRVNGRTTDPLQFVSAP